MVCAPVRSLIPSLKLGNYLSVQAHKQAIAKARGLFLLQAHKSCSVSHNGTEMCFNCLTISRKISLIFLFQYLELRFNRPTRYLASSIFSLEMVNLSQADTQYQICT